MAPAVQTRATLDDLMRDGGQGRADRREDRALHARRDTSRAAWRAGSPQPARLRRATRSGRGLHRQHGFAVPELPSGRESFSPDASYYRRPAAGQPDAVHRGPPTLAVEVRSENDYGPAAEAAMAAKRADYFAAGTAVVWDVDPVAELIHVYRADTPEPHATYARGQVAEAEPAVPGWRPAVDYLLQRMALGAIPHPRPCHGPPRLRCHPACASLAGTSPRAGPARVAPCPAIRTAGPLGRRREGPAKRGAGPRGGRSARSLRRRGIRDRRSIGWPGGGGASPCSRRRAGMRPSRRGSGRSSGRGSRR